MSGEAAGAAPGALPGRRADDVLAMQRLAARRDGTRALLAWLGRRTGFRVALVDRSGGMLLRPPGTGEPGEPEELQELVTAGIAKVLAERSRSVVLDGRVDGEPHTAYLVSVGGPEPAPLLTAVGREAPDGLPTLLADAARTVGLCWQVEEARRTRRRSEAADARSREAVLHLLMVGGLPAAYRIAAALRPRLPRQARFYVVECASERRQEVVDQCAEAAGGRAWIVPCPVRSNHVLALVPVEGGQAGSLDRAIADRVADCRVGVSDEIALRDTAIGYEQAFHALAVARNSPGRRARFSSRAELASLLDERGLPWAGEVLGPLLDHVPRRRTDPGVEELVATLNSWLYFGSHATAHLKVHRNTLAARLRLVEELLRRDLDRVAEQAELSLALRVHGLARRHARGAAGDGRTVTLDELLGTPEVRRWAGLQLRPLDEGNRPSGLATVRTWLENDARIGPTAAALGISVPGARKRLTRVEDALERSLLQAPSAKYDLWLALRALRAPGPPD